MALLKRVLTAVHVRSAGRVLSRQCSVMATAREWETLAVSQEADGVTVVELNRPDRSNAMNQSFWREFGEVFQLLSYDSDCRAVVLSGRGKNFSSGLDLTDFVQVFSNFSEGDDPSRKAFVIRGVLQPMQETFTAVEKCPKPVVAAVHGACIGGGVDMITACDIRLCSSDAWFQVKEVEIGMAPDVGTLQRLPRVTGNDSLMREVVYTGRRFSSEEAEKMGLVSHVYEDKDATVSAAMEMAKLIASKSPIAVQGSKVNLNYSRDHSVADGLEYVLTWNSVMLQTEDMPKAFQAAMLKEKPVFSKL